MDSRDAPKDSPATISETPYPQRGAPNGRDLRGGAEGLFKGLITAHAMLKHYLFALSSIMILSGSAWSAPVAPPSWFGSPTLIGTVSGVPMFNYETVGAPVTLGIWSGYDSGSPDLSYLLTVDASFVGSQVSWDGYTWEISSVQPIPLSTLNAYPWYAPDSTYTGSVYIGYVPQTGIRPSSYGSPVSWDFHVSAGDYLGEMVNGSLFVESEPESDLLQWNLSNDTNGVLTHEIVVKDESGVVVGGGVYTLNPGDANTYQVDLPEGFTIDEDTRWAINPSVDGVPVDVAPPTPSAPVVIGSGSQTGQTGVSPVVFREGQTPEPTDTPNYPTGTPTDYTNALEQIRDTSRMGSDRIVSAVDSLRSELARKDLSVSVSGGGSGGSSSAGSSGVDPDVTGQLNSNLADVESRKGALKSEIEDAFGAPSAVRGVEEESVSGFNSEWPELEFPWIGGTTKKFSTNPYALPNIGPKLQAAAPAVNRFITFILCLSTFIYCFQYSRGGVATEAEAPSETTWMDMVPKANWIASGGQYAAIKAAYLAFVTVWIGMLTISGSAVGGGGDIGIMQFISSASNPAKVPHLGCVFDFVSDFIPVATFVALGLFTLFYMVTYYLHIAIFREVRALISKAA